MKEENEEERVVSTELEEAKCEIHSLRAHVLFCQGVSYAFLIFALVCIAIAIAGSIAAANSAEKRVNYEWVRATGLLFDSLTYQSDNDGEGGTFTSVERTPKQLQKLVQEKADTIRKEKGIRGPAILTFDLREIDYNWKPSRSR